MAKIQPFSGYRFDEERVNLAQVLDENNLDARSVFHIISPRLAKSDDTDLSHEKCQLRSRAFEAQYTRAGILAQDEEPSFYWVRSSEGENTFEGFIGVIRAEAELLSADSVEKESSNPHELAGRPLYIAYDDATNEVQKSVRGEIDRDADMSIGDELELWVVDDETTSARMQVRIENADFSVIRSSKEFQEACKRDDGEPFLAFFAETGEWQKISKTKVYGAKKISADILATLRTVLETRFVVDEAHENAQKSAARYHAENTKPVSIAAKSDEASFLNELLGVVVSHTDATALHENERDDVSFTLTLPKVERGDFTAGVLHFAEFDAPLPEGLVLYRKQKSLEGDEK